VRRAVVRRRCRHHCLCPGSCEGGIAIESAGLAKRTLYELEPGNVGRDTFRRAKDSIDAVNDRILDLIRESWGRQ